MQRFVRTWCLAAWAATLLAAAVPASLIADAQGLDSTQLERGSSVRGTFGHRSRK